MVAVVAVPAFPWWFVFVLAAPSVPWWARRRCHLVTDDPVHDVAASVGGRLRPRA
jgi:hypothetical protein